ncbi:MAG: glucokinase [Proteobacteria bacterium]|nr:MAG: glucokinase [Pseudomonadota bacterium]
MGSNMILAGDAGGTKTRIALYDNSGGRFTCLKMEQYPSGEFSRFEDILSAFSSQHGAAAKAACFGVPGPVVAGQAKTTNLPWVLSENSIAKALNIPQVKLVNDLLATAAAVPHLSEQDLETLHAGTPLREPSHIGILAPGTGLGQGFLFYIDGRYHPMASEGGHADFAPNSELEIELLRFLRRTYLHVSYERILCGSGLINIYNFLKDYGYAKESPTIAERISKEHPPAVIASAGMSGEDELCSKALEMFVTILGAVAGNIVISNLTIGGVYLGGGIPPKILPRLRSDDVVDSYTAKGRFSDLVKAVPLKVIKDDRAAVLGAASIAAQCV